VFGAGSFRRSGFIQPYRCQNVLVDGVTIVNSPMWEIELKAMQSYGPALMAGAELITMLRSFDIRRVNNTFYSDRTKQ
jgi:hypothetical protein